MGNRLMTLSLEWHILLEDQEITGPGFLFPHCPELPFPGGDLRTRQLTLRSQALTFTDKASGISQGRNLQTAVLSKGNTVLNRAQACPTWTLAGSHCSHSRTMPQSHEEKRNNNYKKEKPLIILLSL